LRQRVDERIRLERHALHDVAQRRQLVPEPLALLGGELAHDGALVARQDHLGLVEQRARPLERAAQVNGQVAARRGVRVLRQGQLVTGGPQDDLDDGEKHDPDRDGLRTHDALEPAERPRDLGPAGRRERPDEQARRDDGHEHEPDRPVHDLEHRRHPERRPLGRVTGRGAVRGRLPHAVHVLFRRLDLGRGRLRLPLARGLIRAQGASPIWIS
jgi:hypothetical protein